LSERHGGYAAKSHAGRSATPPGALCERSLRGHDCAISGSNRGGLISPSSGHADAAAGRPAAVVDGEQAMAAGTTA
jgi:hypothetical protein